MKRQYSVHNGSAFRDEEILPLVQFAWDYAWSTAPSGKDQLTSHPRYRAHYGQSENEKNCVWAINLVKSKYIRAGTAYTHAWQPSIRVRLGDPRKLSVKWPVQETYPRFKNMPEYEVRSWREMIVMIVAHEVAHLTGYGGRKSGEEMSELTAWDAVEAYRKNQVEVDGRISALIKNVDERKAIARKRAQDKREEKNSAQFKIARLDAQEAMWMRKLKTALTKIKKIRRSRSAVVAAHKRKLALPNSFYQKYNVPPEPVIAHMSVPDIIPSASPDTQREPVYAV